MVAEGLMLAALAPPGHALMFLPPQAPPPVEPSSAAQAAGPPGLQARVAQALAGAAAAGDFLQGVPNWEHADNAMATVDLIADAVSPLEWMVRDFSEAIIRGDMVTAAALQRRIMQESASLVQGLAPYVARGGAAAAAHMAPPPADSDSEAPGPGPQAPLTLAPPPAPPKVGDDFFEFAPGQGYISAVSAAQLAAEAAFLHWTDTIDKLDPSLDPDLGALPTVTAPAAVTVTMTAAALAGDGPPAVAPPAAPMPAAPFGAPITAAPARAEEAPAAEPDHDSEEGADVDARMSDIDIDDAATIAYAWGEYDEAPSGCDEDGMDFAYAGGVGGLEDGRGGFGAPVPAQNVALALWLALELPASPLDADHPANEPAAGSAGRGGPRRALAAIEPEAAAAAAAARAAKRAAQRGDRSAPRAGGKKTTRGPRAGGGKARAGAAGAAAGGEEAAPVLPWPHNGEMEPSRACDRRRLLVRHMQAYTALGVCADVVGSVNLPQRGVAPGGYRQIVNESLPVLFGDTYAPTSEHYRTPAVFGAHAELVRLATRGRVIVSEDEVRAGPRSDPSVGPLVRKAKQTSPYRVNSAWLAWFQVTHDELKALFSNLPVPMFAPIWGGPV